MMGRKKQSEIKAELALAALEAKGKSSSKPTVVYDVELAETLFKTLAELEDGVKKWRKPNNGK
jgi:hypothetical protein